MSYSISTRIDKDDWSDYFKKTAPKQEVKKEEHKTETVECPSKPIIDSETVECPSKPIIDSESETIPDAYSSAVIFDEPEPAPVVEPVVTPIPEKSVTTIIAETFGETVDDTEETPEDESEGSDDDIIKTEDEDADEADTEESVPVAEHKKGGRPKGSTNKKKTATKKKK